MFQWQMSDETVIYSRLLLDNKWRLEKNLVNESMSWVGRTLCEIPSISTPRSRRKIPCPFCKQRTGYPRTDCSECNWQPIRAADRLSNIECIYLCQTPTKHHQEILKDIAGNTCNFFHFQRHYIKYIYIN